MGWWDDTRVKAAAHKCRGCFSLYILDPQLVTTTYSLVEFEEAANDATPDSLPFSWQQNLLWLNCDSLRHVAESQCCFGISREAFVLYHLYGWDTGDPTVLNAVQTDSSRDSLFCSVESNLFPDFLKSAYITVILSLTKFSPIGVAVLPLQKKMFFSPRNRCSKVFCNHFSDSSKLLLNSNTKIFSNQGLKSHWDSISGDLLTTQKLMSIEEKLSFGSSYFALQSGWSMFALCRAKGILALFEQTNWKQ